VDDNAVAEILLFEDSVSDLIHADTGLNESCVGCAQNTASLMKYLVLKQCVPYLFRKLYFSITSQSKHCM
jgi:hypothetical protein